MCMCVRVIIIPVCRHTARTASPSPKPASEQHHGGNSKITQSIFPREREREREWGGWEGEKGRHAYTHTTSIYSTQFPYFTTLIFLMISYQPATIRMINWRPNTPDTGDTWKSLSRRKTVIALWICCRQDSNLNMSSALNRAFFSDYKGKNETFSSSLRLMRFPS